MVTKELEIEFKGVLFKIEEDHPEVGAYLYLYKDGKCIKDFLQNDIENCKQFALDEYGVPKEIWKEND